jgi:hypothetical protein
MRFFWLAALSVFTSVTAAQAQRYDLLISGGMVIDRP